jgi:hypothetical protein
MSRLSLESETLLTSGPKVRAAVSTFVELSLAERINVEITRVTRSLFVDESDVVRTMTITLDVESVLTLESLA